VVVRQGLLRYTISALAKRSEATSFSELRPQHGEIAVNRRFGRLKLHASSSSCGGSFLLTRRWDCSTQTLAKHADFWFPAL
jgi:hypothetical protein